MKYQLDIYRPGTCDGDSCIKTFAATASFFSIRVGDLINTKTWEEAVQWPLLRVANVEHVISEASLGIDPAGRITHGILLYTEDVPDTVETRCKSSGQSRQSRS
jgi:hypothetical protein